MQKNVAQSQLFVQKMLSMQRQHKKKMRGSHEWRIPNKLILKALKSVLYHDFSSMIQYFLL